MLINPKKFTEQLSLEKTIEIFNEHGFAGDNELLVHYFKDFNRIGLEYNQSAHLIKFVSGRESIKVNLIHFMGTTKPWRYSTILPFAREWREIYYKIYNTKPWSKITPQEFMLRILYILFPNPAILFRINGHLRKFKRKLFN